MSNKCIRVLLVEDNPADALLLQQAFATATVKYEVTLVVRLADAWRRLGEEPYDVVLLDPGLQGSQGLDTLAQLRAGWPQTAIVVLTMTADEGTALQSLQLGAQDYLIKGDAQANVVARSVRYAIERKHAERALLESEARLARTEAFSLVMATHVGLDGRWLKVPPTLCQLLGYAAEELLASSFNDVTHPDDFEADWSQRQRLIRGDFKSFDLEKRCIRKDGKIVWVYLNCSIVTDEDGKPVHFLTYLRDISERKKTEEAFRRAEADYRSIFENAVEGIFRSTPSGRLLKANPMMAHMLGYESAAECVSKVYDLGQQVYADPSKRSEFTDVLTKRGVVQGFECEFLRKDGSKIWVSLSGRVTCDSDGSTLYYEDFVEDVTEQRQLEEQLRHSQKMEAIGKLAGGVAHDFNNLLTVINGYSALLLEQLPADAHWCQPIREIRKAGERAATLTRQLLALGRKQTLQPQVLNLNSLVIDIEEMFRRLIGDDIVLHISLDPDLGCVYADRAQIEQVLLNLVVNARDAMPNGGELTLQTAEVKAADKSIGGQTETMPDAFVILSVADTGHGIDEEVKAHLFEPFFTTKGLATATGLGLATVYGIVKQSGGHVEVHGEPGCGAKFCIYLPRAQTCLTAVTSPLNDSVAGVCDPGFLETTPVSKRPATILQRTARPSTTASRLDGQGTILLVEDEASVRSLARQVLAAEGYHVLEAPNGVKALDVSQNCASEIDLLVTDVEMPHMGGPQLAEQLLNNRPNLKVLYISGYAENRAARDGAFEAGTHFVQKPFTPDTLVLKVRKVMDSPELSAVGSGSLPN